MLPLDPETRSRLCYAGPRLAEYEARREEAESRAASGDLEGSLKIISETAVAAYTFLGGHFSDPGLDELLTRIGGRILADIKPTAPSTLADPFRADVLHLVSYTGFVGGHTELLRQWLRTIRGMKRKQALFSTELIATVEFERWGELIELADKPYFQTPPSHSRSEWFNWQGSSTPSSRACFRSLFILTMSSRWRCWERFDRRSPSVSDLP